MKWSGGGVDKDATVRRLAEPESTIKLRCAAKVKQARSETGKAKARATAAAIDAAASAKAEKLFRKLYHNAAKSHAAEMAQRDIAAAAAATATAAATAAAAASAAEAATLRGRLGAAILAQTAATERANAADGRVRNAIAVISKLDSALAASRDGTAVCVRREQRERVTAVFKEAAACAQERIAAAAARQMEIKLAAAEAQLRVCKDREGRLVLQKWNLQDALAAEKEAHAAEVQRADRLRNETAVCVRREQRERVRAVFEDAAACADMVGQLPPQSLHVIHPTSRELRVCPELGPGVNVLHSERITLPEPARLLRSVLFRRSYVPVAKSSGNGGSVGALPCSSRRLAEHCMSLRLCMGRFLSRQLILQAPLLKDQATLTVFAHPQLRLHCRQLDLHLSGGGGGDALLLMVLSGFASRRTVASLSTPPPDHFIRKPTLVPAPPSW
ncbi:hypothetical protein JKP88DRAFT_252903 [Tribonema minus]|uniref:Uncharacterized protein n=1 Tax=Tribonema minus TaxID=303371 RepID=A0A836CL39_9STRA|nr:hypothetical protein JKP88DRAFT_252903 [Tribonema minus]